MMIIHQKSDYNDEDVFVHASAIVKNNPEKYKPSLCEGEPVEFDILKSNSKRKLHASKHIYNIIKYYVKKEPMENSKQ